MNNDVIADIMDTLPDDTILVAMGSYNTVNKH